MRNTVGKNLSANFHQLAINQFLGFVLFLILSRLLQKDEFGAFNWALSVLLVSFNILSIGIDQLIIKKIAAGDDRIPLLKTFFVHVIVTGVLFCLAIFICFLYFSTSLSFSILLYLSIGKLFLYFSTPLKQIAGGMENFSALARMSIISNALKVILLTFLFVSHSSAIFSIVIIFVVAELAELFFCLQLFKNDLLLCLQYSIRFSFYYKLLKEAIPQAGTITLAAFIARFDWIYIGLFQSNTKLAEYSFAYKAFELSSLPLLIIAPLLLPLFTRIIQQKINSSRDDLSLLFRIYMIVACTTILLITICWEPVADHLSNKKYGHVNTNTILILSLSLPFLYLNNFLWSYYFAEGGLKKIFQVFVISFLVNLICVPLLTNWLGNEGAALAYLLTMVCQSLLYLRSSQSFEAYFFLKPLIICITMALTGHLLAINLFTSIPLVLTIALLLYISGLAATTQVRKSDWNRLKKVLAW